MNTLVKFLKEWMLVVGMVAGASLYLIYYNIEPLHFAGPFLNKAVAVVQPLLLFLMLFMTFCRIEPKQMKPHRWHWWLLLVQGGSFTVMGLAAWAILNLSPVGHHESVVLLESGMLCMICPTATAAAVVTGKLGGDVAGVTTYTILINILTAVLVPLIVPLIQPMDGMTFWSAFSIILAKVFPLLIMPCVSAWIVRYLFPKLHSFLLRFPNIPFYIWAISLTIAIAVSTKLIVKSKMSVTLLLLIGLVSLVGCIIQFAIGKYIGSSYKSSKTGISEESERRGRAIRRVTAGQALGQKNTVFAIWMGYTFMTPESAIVGGLYSIWHNLFNTWQLHRVAKRGATKG